MFPSALTYSSRQQSWPRSTSFIWAFVTQGHSSHLDVWHVDRRGRLGPQSRGSKWPVLKARFPVIYWQAVEMKFLAQSWNAAMLPRH